MATVIKCDRCGEIYDKNYTDVEGLIAYDRFNGKYRATVDLCPACMSLFLRWIKDEEADLDD